MPNISYTSVLANVESRSLWSSSNMFLAAMSSLLLGLLGYAYSCFSPNDDKKIYKLGGLSVVNAWAFFNKRYEFLRSNRDKTGHNLFSFKLFQHPVVAISGDDGRKAFFGEKDLNFEQGHRLLRGAVPKLTDIKVLDENSDVTALNKRLLKVINRDRLQYAMPTLLSDINKHIEAWGPTGKLDPFKNIYDIVFQTSIRLASCEELATDAIAVEKIRNFYWQYEKSITPVGLLLPWFPGTARRRKDQAAKGLYAVLFNYVNIRRKVETRTSDAIDVLIADGEDDATIVEFVLLFVFGGVVNTAMITCWVLFYLGAYNEWKNKAVAEVRNIITTHSGTDLSEPMYKRLSMIPLSAWEDEMPILDGIIRETIRLLKNGPALRRNLADNFQCYGKTVDKGAFVVYSMEDVHLNERFYSEPFKFDPGRFDSPREEDKRGNMLFLGWGAGRHVCTGMRVAKLELKMILISILSRYEYELVNQAGKPPKQPPQPNRNDFQQSRPIGESYFLQYRKIVGCD